MDQVKPRSFWFLLHPSSRKFVGSELGVGRPDGSCKVWRVLVSSTPQLTEVWGFLTGCRPDGLCKVSRVKVSFTLQLRPPPGWRRQTPLCLNPRKNCGLSFLFV